MNKVILMGRLTRDPEMSQTQSGVTLARFSIAVPRRFQKDATDFINFLNSNLINWFIATHPFNEEFFFSFLIN